MTRRQAWEERLTLAMLPVGATLAVASGVGVVILTGAAIALPLLGRATRPMEAWTVVAALVAVRSTVAALEGLSALAWRPALAVIATWAAVIALWPRWWLAGSG